MKAWFRPLAAGLPAILLCAPVRAQSPSPAPVATPQQSGTAQGTADFSQFHTADQLWAHIQQLQQGPASASPSPRDVMALLHQLTAASAEFQMRYPKDARRWEAKLIFLQYDSMLASSESRDVDTANIESQLQAVAAAPDAPAEAKRQARVTVIQLHIQDSGQETLTPDVEKEILAFIHDFPDEPVVAELQKMRIESLQKTEPAKAGEALDALLKDANPAVVQMAQAEVAKRDLMKKPLELQFTAADGSKVDLKQLRGKVVLIDFWATWCAPCMEEVPDVVKLYKELHGKGLEIVGISLDQDKSLVEAVTKSYGMAWPQYFDGKGWQNEIASRYGITEIPLMFLVNKKGMVVDPEVHQPDRDEIGKYLGE
jgi:thiol-disulfide isomerase/thioredoxin